MFKSALILAGCVALLLAGCNRGTDSKKLRIAVIPKGTTHEFWKSVESGARRAGEELDVEIIWRGPMEENDRASQIQITQQLASEGVAGIVLAPLDEQALVAPVRAAMNRKIPVVIIDSSLRGEAGKDFVSYLATNNMRGGQIGGEELVRILGGQGKVVLLRYETGSASTDQREAGFMDIMKQKNMTMLVDNRYGGATVDSAKKEAMNLLDKLREADGVFCPNESSTRGMLLALKQAGLAGKIKFVGFDATPPLVEALKAGELDALVAQDPVRMGYEGVHTVVKAIKGEAVPAEVDTGVRLITRENLSDPDIRKFLGME